MSIRKCVAVAVFGMLTGGSADAAFITSLYGTGLNADGTARLNNEAELHYTMLLGSPVDGTPVVYTQAGGFPIGPWLNDAASASSRWIAPSTVRNHPKGDYTFQTTFDLTGFVPGTASLSGKWATDNGGLSISLNGSPLAGTSSGFTAFSAFGTTNGTLFVAGVNTLDFVVRNFAGDTGNPAGLRVEVAGNAELVNTPVPPTALLAVFAVAVAGFARRQRA